MSLRPNTGAELIAGPVHSPLVPGTVPVPGTYAEFPARPAKERGLTPNGSATHA